MIIGGFQKVSLSDYPEKICAIIFTQGCNFRCPFCHNPDLVTVAVGSQARFNQKEVFTFLKNRKGKLDAVTVTGGEPCLQPDLKEALSELKRLGYLIKLDTNGAYPSLLEEVIKEHLVDYIAMDVKTSLDKYEYAARTRIDVSSISNSIGLIKDSGLDYEFRTTVVRPIFERDDLLKIRSLIKNCPLYVLQRFVSSRVLDIQAVEMRSCSDDEIEVYRQIAESFVQKCIVK